VSSMKILIIYPNVHNTSRINLGIAYLSACLKNQGHDVKLFDTTFYKEEGEMSDEDFRSKSLQVTDVDLVKHGVTYRASKFMIDDLRTIITDYKPDILGLNCVDATYHLGKKLMESVQDFKIFSIVGGVRASVDPESIISEQFVNSVCIGEGEEAFMELCAKLGSGNIDNIRNLWIKTKYKIIKNDRRPLIDINTLPMPDWDIFNDFHLIRPMAGKAYRMGGFDMSRGCLYKCT
jgi:anaerobic magnesium-protoporphyrin IX monomethyl ester cyclase